MFQARFAVILAAVVCACPAGLAQPSLKAPKGAKPVKAEAGATALAEEIARRNAELLKRLGDDLGTSAGRVLLGDALKVQDWAAAYADPAKEPGAFREAALGARAARQLVPLPDALRKSSVKVLAASPRLAGELFFAADADKGGDDIAGVYGVLKQLAEKFDARKLDDYATLVAAICVVHDAPLVQHVNENTAKPPTPVELFEYFTKNESMMRYGVRGVPSEVLMYVVDCCAPIGDMQWALQRYAKSPIGPLYFQVRYDNEHLLQGREKQVTAKGFSLPNILQYGGVCADQAYFSSTVGKAVGVPSVYCRGANEEGAHAWLGTLKSVNNKPVWDFETGRYPEFKNVRGTLRDPHYGTSIPDGFLAILTESMTVPAGERQIATGMADAAMRIEELARSKGATAPEAGLLGEAFKPSSPARAMDTASALALLEAAVRRVPASEQAWSSLHALASSKDMTIEQRGRWAGAVADLCGKSAPDFAFLMQSALVEGVDDAGKQAELWERVIARFAQRPDLAATARYRQGMAWEKAEKLQSAWTCYQKIIDDHANDIPFLDGVLSHCAEMLRKAQKTAEIVPMYERAWRKVQRPSQTFGGMFAMSSSWARVGAALADAAEEAGDANKARQVRAQLPAAAGR